MTGIHGLKARAYTLKRFGAQAYLHAEVRYGTQAWLSAKEGKR
jgi:hypothetical protein